MTAVTLKDALAALKARAVAGRAEQAQAYHKITRPYLGTSNPEINALTAKWRRALDVRERTDLASALWETNIFEARLAAAKLLTAGRIPEDAPVWHLLSSWLPDFDSWAIADHVSMAAQKRLVADPGRMADIALWTEDPHMWTRRAAMVTTLPFARPKAPDETEIACREQVLGWAARYVDDPEWFIQKSVAWWLRDLSKRQPARVVAFLAEHGAGMKPFARKEAAKYL